MANIYSYGASVWGSGDTGTCERPNRELGESCNDNTDIYFGADVQERKTQCKSGRCDASNNVCIPIDFTGRTDDFCTHDRQCSTSVCYSQTCRQLGSVALGHFCGGYNELCEENALCDAAAGNSRQCIPEAARFRMTQAEISQRVDVLGEDTNRPDEIAQALRQAFPPNE